MQYCSLIQRMCKTIFCLWRSNSKNLLLDEIGPSNRIASRLLQSRSLQWADADRLESRSMVTDDRRNLPYLENTIRWRALKMSEMVRVQARARRPAPSLGARSALGLQLTKAQDKFQFELVGFWESQTEFYDQII